MKPLTHGRNLTEFLDQYGVTDPARGEALEVDPLVKMVVPVDDARHLARPLAVPAAHYYVFESGAAGVYSAVQITAAGAGAYITFAYSTNSAIGILGPPANPTLTPTGPVTTPQLIVGSAAPNANVQTGTFAGAPPNGWVTVATNYPYPGCPFHLEAGATLTIFRSVLNSLFIAYFGIQEIPV